MKTIILMMITSSLIAAIGEVSALKGQAEMTRKEAKFDVTKGMAVELQDLLSTKASSKAQVLLHDDTVITIGPKSEYRFERYADSGDVGIEMRLDHGFFKAVTGKIGKIAPQRFRIKTKAATIGVRGTQFMAYVSDEEEKIGCIQGSIIVWTEEGEFIVNAGEMIHYKDKRWRREIMEMESFRPVLVGMALDKKRRYERDLYLPKFRESYVLQEQLLNELQSQEPFSFSLGFDASQQPPSFNP